MKPFRYQVWNQVAVQVCDQVEDQVGYEVLEAMKPRVINETSQ